MSEPIIDPEINIRRGEFNRVVDTTERNATAIATLMERGEGFKKTVDDIFTAIRRLEAEYTTSYAKLEASINVVLKMVEAQAGGIAGIDNRQMLVERASEKLEKRVEKIEEAEKANTAAREKLAIETAAIENLNKQREAQFDRKLKNTQLIAALLVVGGPVIGGFITYWLTQGHKLP